MRVGYGWGEYKELCEARNRIPKVKRTGLPFVSVAGPNFGAAKHKIMYVGKSPWATNDEGDATASQDEYQASVSWSSYWLGRQTNPSSAFWDFAAKIVKQVMPGAVEPATSYIAWSNLAKVAQMHHGAPDAEVSSVMHAAERITLLVELDRFAPDLVVLVSNEAVWDVATSVFGDKMDMTTQPDGTWTRKHPMGFNLYWTRHPQGTPLEWRAEHAVQIGNLIDGS
jgi:hypothetical protein